MLQFILEFLSYIFIESFVAKAIVRLWHGAQYVCLLFLKGITLNKKSVSALREDYKDTVVLNLLALALMVGVLYLLITWIR